MTSPSRLSLAVGASLFVGCSAASQDAPPRTLERLVSSVGSSPRLRVEEHVRPPMRRRTFDFFALPTLEAAPAAGRTLAVEKATSAPDSRLVVRVADTIGTLRGLGADLHTDELAVSVFDPVCEEQRPQQATFEGVRRDGWSADRVSFVEWSGWVDSASCRLHTSQAREAVAVALLPGLLYAARASGGGPRHALYLVSPQAAWSASDPPEQAGSYVHTGVFTVAALSLEKGRASALSLSIPVRALWAWNGWRRGGEAPVDDLKLALEEAQLEIYLDVSWPTTASAPRAVLLASDEPRFARHPGEETVP